MTGKCKYCDNNGYVSMKIVVMNEKDYPYAYSICCKCEKGRLIAKRENRTVWNGEHNQTINRKLMTFVFVERLK
jgi:hypothetical protein